MNDNQHISQEALLDYILRKEYLADADNIRMIETHLNHCRVCADRHRVFQDRYLRLRTLSPPSEKLAEINRMIRDKRRSKPIPMLLKAAAGFAIMCLTYGSSAWWINYRFDRGESGLAELRKDYDYALEIEYTRGTETRERPDILEFKKGVRMLFESKETTFGLFPGYNQYWVTEAESIFKSVLTTTQDDLLKKKCVQYLKKIERIKKEQILK